MSLAEELILQLYIDPIMIQNSYLKSGLLLLTEERKKHFYNQNPAPLQRGSFGFSATLIQSLCQAVKQSTFLKKNSFFLLIFMVGLFIATEYHISGERTKFYTRQGQSPCVRFYKSTHNSQFSVDEDMTFYEFKTKYNKKYQNPQQELFRSIVFSANKDKINKHNSKIPRTFKMAINQFADLTPLQFGETYTNLFKSDQKIQLFSKKLTQSQKSIKLTDSQQPEQQMSSQKSQFSETDSEDIKYIIDSINEQKNIKKKYILDENHQFIHIIQAFCSQKNISQNKSPFVVQQSQKNKTQKIERSSPLKKIFNRILVNNLTINSLNLTLVDNGLVSIDWTSHSGKIRYQGICGACYTFATSDVLASLYSIYRFGFFVPLSTQQVVDCSLNGLTYGCNGGFLQGSYSYMQMEGLQTDFIYPYTAASSGLQSKCKIEGGSFKVASFHNIQEGDCQGLVNQLNYGPVSIGIAGYRLQFYSQGIFNDCNEYVDHAVVLIGYKSGLGWKIKNSWGSDWGIGGYAWIADGNNCGICNMAVSARI